MLSDALRYAERGWKVFPVSVDKTPRTPNGYLDATTDEDQIRRWFENCDAKIGIGIATGKASGFVVLDIDKGHGGLESVVNLPGDLSATLVIGTGGGGLHYYFKATDEELKNRTSLLPGIDFRGDGGYVVAPPSLHLSGKKYVVVQEEEINAPPTWLAPFVKRPALPALASCDDRTTASPPAMAVPEGGRNDFLTRLGGVMRRRGLSPEAIAAALQAENRGRCKPPLPEPEVARIARNVGLYVPENPVPAIAGPVTARALSVTAAELASPAIAYLKDKEKVKGQPTMIRGLDELLGGGKRLGEVTAWHAIAKTGKNTFWHKQMHLWLKAGIPVGYASRELNPEEEVLPDLLSIEFQENARKAEMTDERCAGYARCLADWNHLYFSKGYGFFPPEELQGWIAEMKGLGVNYLFFDHLHYMLEDPEEHKTAAKLIRDLKATAKRLDMHFDIIIQPNKLQDGEKLSLNSIKGGAAIGQAIDNLLTLERHTENGEKHMARLTLKAARSKLASEGSVLLLYDPVTIDTIEVKDVTPPAPLEALRHHSTGHGLNEKLSWFDERY